MKIAIISIFTLVSIQLMAQVTTAPYFKTMIPIKHIYVPVGFDSNDLSEVVIEGQLPDLCYKAPEVYISRDTKDIKIKVVAYKSSDKTLGCPRVKVPFIEVVNTGILERGDYRLLGNEKTKFQKNSFLNVAQSVKGTVDDYIYAKVESVDFDGYKRVTLKGYNPSDCFEFDKVEVYGNGKDTYSVLPILKQVSETCVEKEVKFAYEFDLPDTIQRNKILLHIRAMNGKSFNRIIRKN
ncbi:hypothetical protein N9O57_00215 [bacterium]|nr:hypothetical protein [bacterium]